MTEKSKNVVAWTLVSIATLLGLRAIWLWNRVSPVLANNITDLIF
jgi:hypothetical protein